MKAFNKTGEDITATVFAANGMMKVDADYSGKPYEEWLASDWPSIYQSPAYHNLYASGIAFAPPHGMSKPLKSKNGTPINTSKNRYAFGSYWKSSCIERSLPD